MTKWRKGRKDDYMYEFSSVSYWIGQLRDSGVINANMPQTGTRTIYLSRLRRFNEWLAGREFDVLTQIVADNQIVNDTTRQSFANIEELLRFGHKGNTMAVKKIINQYMVEPVHNHLSQSTMNIICASLRSYFDTNDVVTSVKFNRRKRDAVAVTENPVLAILDLYKMLSYAKIDHTTRAAILVKFHAGLDRSALADRFNYQAYPQIAKFCGTIHHRDWDWNKCPIPIQLVRVKTGVQFTTFIDRDALDAVKDYLDWREETRGPHDMDGPLFFTTKNMPISTEWISKVFNKLAEYARLQKKISPRQNKIAAHEVRDLLKTTLITCGCPEHMADHIIGHKPQDSYVKISQLYPEKLRQEYVKASHVLNIFSHMESIVKNPELPDIAEEKLRKSNSQVEELLKRVNELKARDTRKDTTSGVTEDKFYATMRIMLEVLDELDPDLRKSIKEKLKGIL